MFSLFPLLKAMGSLPKLVWVKHSSPQWPPGKWQGLTSVVWCWLNFHPYPPSPPTPILNTSLRNVVLAALRSNFQCFLFFIIETPVRWTGPIQGFILTPAISPKRSGATRRFGFGVEALEVLQNRPDLELRVRQDVVTRLSSNRWAGNAERSSCGSDPGVLLVKQALVKGALNQSNPHQSNQSQSNGPVPSISTQTHTKRITMLSPFQHRRLTKETQMHGSDRETEECKDSLPLSLEGCKTSKTFYIGSSDTQHRRHCHHICISPFLARTAFASHAFLGGFAVHRGFFAYLRLSHGSTLESLGSHLRIWFFPSAPLNIRQGARQTLPRVQAPC